MTNLKLIMAFMLVLFAIPSCGGKNPQKPVKERKESKMEVKHLTKSEFLSLVYNFEKNPKEWKYEGSKPAIVDFYATWCGPCKVLSPIIEELAKEYDGKIVVYKVDVDKEQDLAAAFNVRSIPTLLWIPMQGEPFLSQGMMPKADLKKAIDEKLLR